MKHAAVLLLLLPLWLHALTFHELQSTSQVRITAPSVEEVRNIGRYVNACFLLVDEALGVQGEPRSLVTVEEKTEAARVHCEELSVTFGQGAGMLEFTEAVMRVLLMRRSQDMFAGRGAGGPLCQFMAAGLAHRQTMRVRNAWGDAPNLDYLPARFLYSNGIFPDLHKLMTAPVPVDFTNLFQIYAMHCDLLITALEHLTSTKGGPRRKNTFLRELLEMDAFGRAPAEAANFVLASHLPKGTAFSTVLVEVMVL